MFGSSPWTSRLVLDYPTGTVTALEAFGYGVTRGGWKIGGFATGFYATGLAVALPSDNLVISDAMGGFGGFISGGAGRFGPFAYSLNVRLGAGLMFAEGVWTMPVTYGSNSFNGGAFLICGGVDGEIGLLVVPAMLVSAYISAQAVMIPTYVSLVAAVVPTVGVRITWGSF